MNIVALVRQRFALLYAQRLASNPAARRAAVGGGILGLSMLVGLTMCATAPSAAPQVRTEKAWPVSVVTIAPAHLTPMFNAFGKVEATRVARIQTDLVADITAVHVREGQWVAKGDVLLTLDAAAYALTVREREAGLARELALLARIETEAALTRENTERYASMAEIAQKKVQRHQDLFAKRMIAQSLLDEVIEQANAAAIENQKHRLAIADFPNRIAEQQARAAQSESLLARAQLDVAHATLRAPFAGPVLIVGASPGNHAAMGQVLVEVADAEGLEVRVPVPDGDAAAMRRQLAAGAGICARARQGDLDVTLVLARLGGSVRAGQSGFDAFFRLEPVGATPLEIGRVLDLQVTLPPEHAVVALPVQSLYDSDRIYLVEHDRLQAVTVERVGDHQTETGEYRVLVRAPELTAGRRVITTQLPKAIGGLLVAPVG